MLTFFFAEKKAAQLVDTQRRLAEQRGDAGVLEQRLDELRQRLQRKKQLNQQLAAQLSDASTKSNKIHAVGRTPAAAAFLESVSS